MLLVAVEASISSGSASVFEFQPPNNQPNLEYSQIYLDEKQALQLSSRTVIFRPFKERLPKLLLLLRPFSRSHFPLAQACPPTRLWGVIFEPQSVGTEYLYTQGR